MKKALSLLLVLVLALSMSTVAFAATAETGTHNPANVYNRSGTPVKIDDTAYTDIGDAIAASTFGAGTFIEIELDATMFEWKTSTINGVENQVAYFTDGTITAKEIENGRVKITAKVKSGSQLFDKAVIEREDGKMWLRVKAKDPLLLTSDSDIDFEVDLTMAVNNKKYEPWTFAANYNPEDAGMVLKPDAEDEGDDIYDGQLVKPDAYNPNWVGVLDEDDTIEGTFKLFKGRNFYMYAEPKVGDDDAETVDAYGFDQVYRLTYSSNAVSSIKHINFVGMSDGYYVYGSKSGAALKGKADVKKDLVYLGTSDQDLPLYSRYYLAASQIDLDIDDIIDEPTIDAPIPADDGGGDGYIPNVNDNPGTGK